MINRGVILGEWFINQSGQALFWSLLSLSFVLALGLYCLFALLVIRQIDLLNSLLRTNLFPVLKFIAVFHAALAFGILLLALSALSALYGY